MRLEDTTSREAHPSEAARVHFERVIADLPAVVYALDREGGVCLANQRFRALVGTTCGGAEGPLTLPPALAAALREGDAHVWAGKPSHDAEVTLPLPGGARTFLASKFLVRDAEGRPTACATLATDLTVHHQLEAQLRQSQKMEAIGQLAGGVAHDFNNILVAILGYSELARRRLAAGDPLLADLLEIRRAGERAANLTRQLLAVSRRQVLQPRVLEMGAHVQEMLPMLRRLIGEHIELELHAPATPLRVRADPGQLEQVVLNLVVNARDAMPAGGRLTVSVGEVTLDVATAARHTGATPGPHVVLSVRDTGIGMDAATRARLFEPFFTTKPAGQGTGLGLSTVYGIVRQSGGFLDVESAPGDGATFRVALPRVQATAEHARPTETRAATRPANETVLVVEDEAVLRELVSRVLREAGYRVLTAADGADALAVLGQHRGPIHCLVTDLVMPHLGGRDLVQRVSASRPDIRVLFISGYTGEVDPEGLALPPDAEFLAKPFTPDALVQKVRTVLERTVAA